MCNLVFAIVLRRVPWRMRSDACTYGGLWVNPSCPAAVSDRGQPLLNTSRYVALSGEVSATDHGQQSIFAGRFLLSLVLIDTERHKAHLVAGRRRFSPQLCGPAPAGGDRSCVAWANTPESGMGEFRPTLEILLLARCRKGRGAAAGGENGGAGGPPALYIATDCGSVAGGEAARCV